MLSFMEFRCDGCAQPISYDGINTPGSAAAEQRMANAGWHVTCIGKRMWHFCPLCKAEHSELRLRPQSTGDTPHD